MRTIMLQDRTRIGQVDELIFVAPQHIVSVKYDAADTEDGGGSIVRLSTGEVILAGEPRDEIVQLIEAEEA